MKLSQYRKLVAAVVGITVILLVKYGVDLRGNEAAIVDLILGLSAAYGVFYLPNEPKEPQ